MRKLGALWRIFGRKPQGLQFECEWVIGHGNFMLPDPTSTSHGAIRGFTKGMRTRVTIELIEAAVRERPPGAIAAAPLSDTPKAELNG